MGRLLIATVLLFLGQAALASEIIYDQEQFFAVPENAARFEELQRSGELTRQKAGMAQNCERAARSDEERDQCACMAQKVEKVDDRRFFFDSVLAYQMYQELVRARQEGDAGAEARVRERQSAHQSFVKEMAQACGA